MITDPIGLASAALSFLGGALLSTEALFVREHLYAERGATRLLERLKAKGKPKVLKDWMGRPLDSENRLKDWLAERSLALSRWGFGLLTAGFAIEVLRHFV